MKNLKTIFTIFILVLIAACSKDSDETSTPAESTETLTPITSVLSVTNINPAKGTKNTSVTITGTGFSTTTTNNTVTINGKTCPVVNSTSTQLVITIPPKAGSGKIKVGVAAANVESSDFEFLESIIVTTIAGSTRGFADGQGANAQFSFLQGIILDGQGNLLVADDDRIRKVSLTNGAVTTIAGSTFGGFANGQGILADFSGVNDIAKNAAGTMFVTDDFNNKVRAISSSGLVSTFAGSTSGFLDGNLASAKFSGLAGIVIDGSGNIFIADRGNHRIRKISGNNVTTFAGSGTLGSTNGQGVNASFTLPKGLTIDSAGNLFVTDGIGKRIRKITPTGLVSTIAGSSTQGFLDGQGVAARFNLASGITIDSQNNLFVADEIKIRKISPTGLVTTIAGTGAAGFVDGNAITTQFSGLQGIAIDAQGNLYVADAGNNKIRKITFD